MTDAQKRRFVRRIFQLAERYGVEDVEPREIIYAVEAVEARNETPLHELARPEQIAKFLWGAWGLGYCTSLRRR